MLPYLGYHRFLVFLPLFWSSVGERTESGREGGRIGKGSRARTRTRVSQSATVLRFGALPPRLSAPTGYHLFNVSLIDSVDDHTQKLGAWGSSKPQMTEISYLWLWVVISGDLAGQVEGGQWCVTGAQAGQFVPVDRCWGVRPQTNHCWQRRLHATTQAVALALPSLVLNGWLQSWNTTNKTDRVAIFNLTKTRLVGYTVKMTS